MIPEHRLSLWQWLCVPTVSTNTGRWPAGLYDYQLNILFGVSWDWETLPAALPKKFGDMRAVRVDPEDLPAFEQWLEGYSPTLYKEYLAAMLQLHV